MTLAILYSRFSTERQQQGASLSRQTEAAKRYCEAHGLTLSDEQFHDAGVSAFKGKNVAEGELGRFIELVETGVIPKGTVLIIENNDRLSRMNHRKAARLFEDILEAGVDIVTLSDQRRYTLEDIEADPLLSVMIILTAARAHQESAMKSMRLKHAWEKNAEDTKQGKRIRSTQGPHWLRWENDEWVVDEERAEIVREIFRRFADGEGSSSIGNDLRRRGVKPPRSSVWYDSSILQLLRKESPFGTLEIGKGQNKDREIVATVEDYFPRIVDRETEGRVKERLTQLRRGRNAKDPDKAAPTARKTKGAWTGRLHGADGQRLKVKRFNPTLAYVGQVDGRYCKAVNKLDGMLRDGWEEIRAAWEAAESPEEIGLGEWLEEAIEAVGTAQRRYDDRPSPARLAALEAAREELDEARREAREQARKTRLMQTELPISIADLEAHEVNRWVRMVVERADVGDLFEGQGPLAIFVKLKNGASVTLGTRCGK